MSSFADILDRPTNEIERPKPLPVGTYHAVVQGQPRHDKSSKKGTPFVEFTLKILAAQDDVDAEALTAMLTRPDGSTKSLQDQTIRATFYITEDAAWRLTGDVNGNVGFLDHLGIDRGDKSQRQRIAEAPGRQVYITVRHEATQDGTGVIPQISGYAAVQ